MKNGLKGITDATVFCKSMKKGGPAPMIRSMKSYEVGGMTDTASGECYEMVQEGPGRPKRRKKKKRRKFEYLRFKYVQFLNFRIGETDQSQ